MWNEKINVHESDRQTKYYSRDDRSSWQFLLFSKLQDFRLVQTQSTCRQNLNTYLMMKLIFDSLENIVGKREMLLSFLKASPDNELKSQ